MSRYLASPNWKGQRRVGRDDRLLMKEAGVHDSMKVMAVAERDVMVRPSVDEVSLLVI